MDYNTLLELATNIGYELAMSGAETFRVEESVIRILSTYGLQPEVFAIPNCLIVSIETDAGECLTRMRRIGPHGNDLDSVERFNGLSRAICNRKPDPKEGYRWLELVRNSRVYYSKAMTTIGNFLGAAGFAVFFGGTWMDGLVAAPIGFCLRFVTWLLQRARMNQIFTNVVASFLMCFTAIALTRNGIGNNVNMIIIGNIMLLIPGIALTNSLRDMISGDIMSGMLRFFDAVLVAAAIAAGFILAASLFGGAV